MSETTLKKRIDYIDIARGIGIILVVMGHCSFGGGFYHFIHAFHMPVFFVISGFLYRPQHKGSFGDYVKKRVKALFIPYVVFGLGTYLFRVLSRMPDVFAGTLDENLLEPLIHLLWINSTGLAISGEFWFLSALFITLVLFDLLLRRISSKRLIGIVIAVLACVGCIWTRFMHFKLPWSITSAFVGIGFIYVGYMLKLHQENKYVKPLLSMRWYTILLVFTAFGAMTFLNKTVNMRTGYYDNIVLFWINAVALSLATFNLAKVMDQLFQKSFLQRIKNYLITIGDSSIAYVCLNSLYVTFIAVILNFAFKKKIDDPISFARAMFSFICTMAMIYVTNKLIMKTRAKIILGK